MHRLKPYASVIVPWYLKVGHVQDFFMSKIAPSNVFTLRSSKTHNNNLAHVNHLYATKDPTAHLQAMCLGLNPGSHMFAGIPGLDDIIIEASPGHPWPSCTSCTPTPTSTIILCNVM